MDLSNRITQVEDEIKVLKNEVLAVLLDVKESLLTRENPFNPQPKFDTPAITINQMAATPAETRSPEAVKQEPAVENPLVKPTGAVQPAETMLAEPDDDIPGNDSLDSSDDNNNNDDDGADEILLETIAAKRGNGNGKLKGNSRGRGELPGTGKVGRMPFTGRIDAPFDAENEKRWAGANDARVNSDSSNHEDQFACGQINLAELSKLADWVIATTGQLGPEKTQTILDISEMMGYMPMELKQSLEKMIPRHNIEMPEEKITTRVYVKALNNLAVLLEKEDASEFVMLQMVSQGMNPLTKNGTSPHG
jgi:hypothetical protein